MKKTLCALATLGVAAGFAWSAGRFQEGQDMPKPDKEHAFLKKFAGKWEGTMSMREAADQPWKECKGTEQARMMGEFWAIGEWKAESAEMPMQGIAITGYDPVKKKYVVTWIDSLMPSFTLGEGTVDKSGNILTTEVKTTDCRTGEPVTMTMVQEFKDKDKQVWSMRMKGKDGKEFECMKGESKRR